ncbi:hypothetical protein F6455_13815 [Proteobacteria bacterium 005FR1]|nr:hypothetical protein [Proteobacteria bacterium 005FR1]
MLNPELLKAHSAWRAKGAWRGSFSIAAWLRFPEGLTEVVQLMLCFRDQERRKSYVIDRCLPNRQTLILLNGIVDLDITGEVADMSLFLTGPAEDAAWILDEHNIEPRQIAVLEEPIAKPMAQSQRS